MWLVVFVIIAGILCLTFFNLFFKNNWDYRQFIIISAYALLMAVILVLSLNSYYYEINKKDLTVSRFGKKYVYFYSDIIYIDEEQSKKSKTLCFVTKFGDVKYLTFDKEGKIFEVAISRCKNLISLEEVKKKFPGIQI